ncbi:protein FAM179A-like [Canna indica]|uniref:Protein FAM179A-like n=1 Tax=Canna indica TaxID=4628 RepID=A0AAQ3QKG1_9LILI|nr:protein FAM179A-like [Canna indica]
MALRSLDNALPLSVERPKKVAASPLSAKKPALAGVSRGSRLNDENTPPPPAMEQSVEYIASEQLTPLPNSEIKITVLLDELGSKDWMKVCEALNDLRRMALHHTSLLVPILEEVVAVIVKAMKSPRSALCKTSIMASADIFQSLGQHLLSTTEENAFERLLLQLLLKASQDKKFVCEEAEKALEKMAISMSPLPLLRKLQCYANHANHRVRAKAAVAMSKCISVLGIEAMKQFGIVTLLQVAAELLNDRLPETREAARSIISSIHDKFLSDIGAESKDESSATESWNNFCSSNLSPVVAQLIAKIFSL